MSDTGVTIHGKRQNVSSKLASVRLSFSFEHMLVRFYW